MREGGVQSNHKVVYCQHHVVWRPKHRRAVLVKPVEARSKRILGETAAEQRAEGFELEVLPGHAHLLLELDPPYGIHRLVRQWKGRSSHILATRGATQPGADGLYGPARARRPALGAGR